MEKSDINKLVAMSVLSIEFEHLEDVVDTCIGYVPELEDKEEELLDILHDAISIMASASSDIWEKENG